MFVIVRHGNTFAAGEAPRRIGARTDLPLTATGHAQARALGAHFAAQGWKFGKVLVSPLLRTRQTAEAILAGQTDPATPEYADFLREIDHGPDEDRTEDEVLSRIGSDALTAWDERAVPPHGWSVDAAQRIAAWSTLLAAPPSHDRPTLLVTSNGAARFALLADPALHTARSNFGSLKLPTGSYGLILQSAQGALEVPIWGQRP